MAPFSRASSTTSMELDGIDRTTEIGVANDGQAAT